jgi:hypothetical protein
MGGGRDKRKKAKEKAEGPSVPKGEFKTEKATNKNEVRRSSFIVSNAVQRLRNLLQLRCIFPESSSNFSRLVSSVSSNVSFMAVL